MSAFVLFVLVLQSGFTLGRAQDGQVRQLVCENNRMYLECKPGELLNIVRASYGRHDSPTCPGPVQTTSCHAESSYRIVSQRCMNRQNCELFAVNSLFGDPCVFTKKYLVVDFECIRDPSSQELNKPGRKPTGASETKTACERGNVVLECGTQETLKIQDASYGRHDSVTCPGRMSTTDCHADTSYGIVSERCDGKRTCEVAASNQVFGDPCHGTKKYLEVSYSCTRGGFKTACEGGIAVLECGSKETLKIDGASYGRHDSVTCPGRMATTDCHAASSYRLASQRCDGKRTCDLFSTNEVFGDPCPGTKKYLEVNYTCVKDEVGVKPAQEFNQPNRRPPTTTTGTSRPRPKPTRRPTTVTTDADILYEEPTSKPTRRPPRPEPTGGPQWRHACQNDVLVLECPGKKVISVESANYGRTDTRTCNFDSTKENNCLAPNTASLVEIRCGGLHKCSIPAENDLFGDPCPKVFKYLEVHYKCVEENN